MKNKKTLLLGAFASLLIIATIIGCGNASDILFPGSGSAFQFFAPKFAFLMNPLGEVSSGSNTVSSYTVSATTGALTLAASGVPTNISGCCQAFMDVDPLSRYLFVPNLGNNTVSTFTINPDGTLTGPVGTDAAAGGYTYAVKLHPSGKFLYATNVGDSTISAFTVGTNGALTPAGSALPTSECPEQIIMDWQGRFLYVTHSGSYGGCSSEVVDGFSIDSQTGKLTSLGTFNTGSVSSRGGMVDYSGQYLILANRGNDGPDNGSIAVFTIQSNGHLSAVPGSPFSDTGCEPTTGSPCGPFNVTEAIVSGTAYVAAGNLDSETLSVFTFDTTTGKLTPVSGSPFDIGLSWPHWVNVDTSGKFGYIVDLGDGEIIPVNLATNGTPTPGTPVTAGFDAWSTQLIFSH